MSDLDLGIRLVGDDVLAPCLDGIDRPYLSLDAAASTAALPAVAARVTEVLPRYSSVHRGAGWKSQLSTAAYEEARGRRRGLRRSRRAATTSRSSAATPPRRSTTSRTGSRLEPRRRRGDDRRRAPRQPPAVGAAGSPPVRRVRGRRHLRRRRRRSPRSMHRPARGCSRSPAPRTSPAGSHRSTRSSRPPTSVACRCSSTPPSSPRTARCRTTADFLAWSGHKMYAPFGAGVLLGPRRAFAEGDPFLAGGGAVDLVDLDEVVWTDPPEREEAGSPNVLGAVALARRDRRADGASAGPPSEPTTTRWRRCCATGCAAIDGVRLLGRAWTPTTLPVATFIVDGVPHALVAARLSVRARHRCAARLLLRPPLSDAPPRAHPR